MKAIYKSHIYTNTLKAEIIITFTIHRPYFTKLLTALPYTILYYYYYYYYSYPLTSTTGRDLFYFTADSFYYPLTPADKKIPT